eukprot:6612199-Pyramimonas_sp.AAC.1
MEFVGALAAPWALTGDGNFLIEDLEMSGFTRLVRARAAAPVGVEFTCSQGRGTLIDDVVASDDIAGFLKVGKHPPSPFKTHACLGVDIDHEVVEQILWARREPAPFPECEGHDLPWE